MYPFYYQSPSHHAQHSFVLSDTLAHTRRLQSTLRAPSQSVPRTFQLGLACYLPVVFNPAVVNHTQSTSNLQKLAKNSSPPPSLQQPYHAPCSSLCTPPGHPLPRRRPSALHHPPRDSCGRWRRCSLQTPAPRSSTFASYGRHQAIQKNRALEEEGLLVISLPRGLCGLPHPRR